MSAIVVVAAVFLLVTVAGGWLLVQRNQQQKRKAMHQFLQQFSLLGSVYHLTFSGQEILSDSILGLDGIQRKLLVLQKQSPHTFRSMVIALNDVQECSVRKYYGTIKSGDLKKRTLEHFLEKISLHFSFGSQHPPVEVLFYHYNTHHVFDIPKQERKARHWEAVLTKLQSSAKRIA
jgi:hypothetical protein